MRILIVGIGGQGVLLASKLLGWCALERGMSVRTAETIGMAQRGGSVQSHVTIGEGYFSPLIPKAKANLIIAFDKAEAQRASQFASTGCAVISAEFLDARRLESKKTLNVALLGAALKHLPFDKDEMLGAIRSAVKSEFFELNARALEYGVKSYEA